MHCCFSCCFSNFEAKPHTIRTRSCLNTIGGDRMVEPLGVVVLPFRPTSRIEGRKPHHHVEAARRWCSNTSGPDLGAWPDCWISVEFLHAPILRKGSGSTTTTTKLFTDSLGQIYKVRSCGPLQLYEFCKKKKLGTLLFNFRRESEFF